MISRRQLTYVLAAVGCGGMAGCADDPSTPPATTMASCTSNVELRAHANAAPTEGSATVYGTTAAPQNVTVRAVYVGGVAVERTAFNFRTWTVVLDSQRLAAYARQGVARIPVIAYTSNGCQELPEADEPAVVVDPSTDTPDAAMPDGP